MDCRRYQTIQIDNKRHCGWVTHELTLQDIEQDPNWITKSTCIVTSNVDRAIINAEAAKAFSKCNNVPILRWTCKLSLDFPFSVEAIFYDKDERPGLFAYFVQGGCGQVLNNAHGNCWGDVDIVAGIMKLGEPVAGNTIK